jgi:hypothetical protein
MNTFITPTWVKRESVVLLFEQFRIPRVIAQQATDAQIEQIAENLARAFSEASNDAAEDE